MATDTAEANDLGKISRLRGVVFKNVTRAASAVGVLALVILLVYVTLDAIQPTTADPAWYGVLLATFVLPTTLVAIYGWRRPAVGRVALRAIGATLAGGTLATVLAIWLGGQLGLIVLTAIVVPTVLYTGYLSRHRDALRVGLGTAATAVAGGTVATIGLVFLGAQATLVYGVTVGLPLALLTRYFLRRPAIGSVGAHAITAAVIATAVTAILVEIVTSFLGLTLGETALGVYALGAVVGVTAYALYARAYRSHGMVGLFAPFIPMAGVLAGYLFHREFVITAPVVPLLYAVFAGLPAAAVAYRALGSRRRGHLGLLLPVVPVVGAVAGLAFHERFVLTGPTVIGTYALAVGLALGAYAWYVLFRREAEDGADGPGDAVGVTAAHGAGPGTASNPRADSRERAESTMADPGGPATVEDADADATATAETVNRRGAIGLLAPLVVFGGLLAGLLGARYAGIAGPETWLSVDFLLRSSHYEAHLAGIHPTLIGSLYVMVIVAFMSFPLGVGAAIYLEEYAAENRWTRLIEINIANLAGVPSVVYGLLGVAVFVRYGGLPLGALIVGGFTLSLLILPIVIISAQEAIRAVPDSLRQASYGMGATRWQTIRNVVLPRALPGILTGTILALGRAVGETAPLLMVGFAAIGGVPQSLTGQGTAMPLQVFQWAQDAKPLFREHVAAAGALTLLIVMLAMNAVAILIRNKYQQNS